MSVQHAPTKTRKRSNGLDTRLHGRWLVLTRGVWLALVILTLGTYFASLPVYMAQLQTFCAGTACAYGQLSSGQGGVLKVIGLSTGDYAAYTIALTFASVVVCLVVSTLIILRRSDDRMALLVALMLVTLGPVIAVNTVAGNPSPWQVPNECLSFLALALLVLVFSLFPSGQFVPRWTRWSTVVCLAGVVLSAFFSNAPSPLKTHADMSLLVMIGELPILAITQLYRYRRVSSPMQRQQTKWVVFGIAVPIIVFVSGTVLALIFPMLSEHN